MSYSEYIPYQQNAQFGQAFGHGGQAGQGWPGQGGQGWGLGLGQAAFGQQGFGGWQQGGGGWQQGYGAGPWQRSFSQQDVGEIVRHLVPLLPLIVNQAQQPHAAFGYGYGSGIGGGFGGGFGQGQGQRYLSQQDVGEVVRQLLPVIPQIVSLLQGQQHGQFANAIYGGLGWNNAIGGQGGYGQGGYGQGPLGQGPLGQAAFGNVGNAWGGQRQLNQADVGEIVRHLTAVLPQVIGNLQAFNQQQQRAA
jgi:hypothetical protein